MNGPTTMRGEVLAILAAADGPLTRPEIYERCKLVNDQKNLSVELSTLVHKEKRLRIAGKREREKGIALTLYALADPAAPANDRSESEPRAAKRSTRKVSRDTSAGRKARRSGTKKPRSAHAKRSALPHKVQRNTATSPSPEGFRCGIFSDGAFAIAAAEGEITLTEGETRAMFRYLERMFPEGAPA